MQGIRQVNRREAHYFRLEDALVIAEEDAKQAAAEYDACGLFCQGRFWYRRSNRLAQVRAYLYRRYCREVG